MIMCYIAINKEIMGEGKLAKSDYLQKSRAYKGYHYSVLEPSAIDYLHKRTVEMFKQMKRIFDYNNIRYMICGGTLLGAITSGRFIPWDDDFDVCIFEEDYERAVACLTDKENGLTDGVVLQCVETDPNYYLGWMKIRDRRSHVYPDAPKFIENGVWIDLYKIVKRKAVDVPVLVAEEAIEYLKRRLSVGGLTLEEYDIRIHDGQLMEHLETAKRIREKEILLTHDEFTTRNVYVIWSASKIMLEEKWIEPLRVVTFEGIEVTTFGNAEAYLEQHYGDSYSELPPDEMRRVGIAKITW